MSLETLLLTFELRRIAMPSVAMMVLAFRMLLLEFRMLWLSNFGILLLEKLRMRRLLLRGQMLLRMLMW